MPPTRSVAFLRAINVGGHTVKMDRLRALFAELGLANVETFIASGNVLFDAPSAKVEKLEARIEQHLEKALGYAVMTYIRPLADLTHVATGHPFHTHEADGHALSIGFLKAPLDAAHSARLEALANDYDDFHIGDRELYWLCRGRLSDSRLFGKVLDRAIEAPATFRNVTTIRRLAARIPGV
ncbi:MAG: DUF1697 domain-containing protein [Gemmatimonadota bacterium]|nr:DUF1697 domain-containing protein [Gemmatimonadota bacterium]